MYSQNIETYVFSSNSDFLISILEKNTFKNVKSIKRWPEAGKQISNVMPFNNGIIFTVIFSSPTKRKGYYYTCCDLIYRKDDKNEKIFYASKNENNVVIDFIKILDNKIYFTLTDSENLVYIIDLINDQNLIKSTQHSLGKIHNIWMYDNTSFLITAEKSKDFYSAKIKNNDKFELIEKFNYLIEDYNHLNKNIIYSNSTNTLFQFENKLNKLPVTEILKKYGKINKIDLLSSNSCIISTYKESKDIISNFLFNSNNDLKYKKYKYLLLTYRNGKPNFIVLNQKSKYLLEFINNGKKEN